jgi:hypothetical protein
MQTPPTPYRGAGTFDYLTKLVDWLKRDRVRAGVGITDIGRVFGLAYVPEKAREQEFGCVLAAADKIRIKQGHYGAFDQTPALQADTLHEITESGWLYARFNYATTIAGTGTWTTTTDSLSVTTIVLKASALPTPSAAYLIIPIQKYTFTSGTLLNLPPQTWTGYIWAYDRKVCVDP